MKVSAETLENRQTRLTIEPTQEEVESSMDKAYRRLSKKVMIPGFRKGKAPRDIMERFIGKEALMEEALEDLIPETYKKAVEEQGLDPIAQPEIEIVERKPVKYKATVSLKPLIDLGDYKYVRLDPEKIEVKPDEVDKVIERMRDQQAPWEPVEGPVALGDLAVMDVKGAIGEKAIIDQTGIQYQALEGSLRPVAGFAENLSGMAKGESKEFALTFPDNYPDNTVAGQEATYKVTIHEIKRKTLPELNDEFAKSLGEEGVDSVEALRNRVSEQVQKLAEEEAKRRYEEKTLDTIIGFAKLQYPTVMLDHEIEHMIEDQARQSGFVGEQGVDDFVKKSGKTLEQLNEELKPVAVQRLTRSLVLGKLMEEEKITVEHEEIDAEIDEVARMAGASAENMRKSLETPEAHQMLEQRILTKKTFERIAQIAMGQAKKETEAPVSEASPVETENSGEIDKQET